MTDVPDHVEPPAYPGELTEQAYLDDGTPILFRAIRPDDAARLERLFYRLSPQSLYLRFFTPLTRPNAAAIHHLVTLDYVDRLAIVALIDDEVVGVARFDRMPPDAGGDAGEAEAAVIVEDAWQGRGIATRLLWRLSAAGVARGLHTFTASILASNRRMMRLLSEVGEDARFDLSGGEYVARMRLAGASAPPAPPAGPRAPAR